MAKQKAYAAAGVDIDAAGRTKKRIADHVRSTFGPEVLRDIGQFGGLFAPPWRAYDEPVLVASTDSVGTKVKVASLTGVHHTVGADIVAHCADDILVQGARPLFFLDYLGMGRHDPEVVEAVVKGVAEGCRASGCALLGGEMAELPGFYAEGDYDLVGTIVGIVDRDAILDGSRVRAGDVLVGLGSDGLHTNGYSLARKVLFDTAGLGVETHVAELGTTVGEALLARHRCYVSPILSLMEDLPVRAMAHITGGGLLDNVPRSLPSGLGARVRGGSWPVLPIFTLLQRLGDVDREEMFQVFNMGLGMVIVVPQDRGEEAVGRLIGDGEAAYVVGEVVQDPDHEVRIV